MTGQKENLRPAVFLDRDGVLNHDPGYVFRVEDLKVLPGVPTALQRLKAKGYLLVVVSNQSGIARGMYTIEDAERFTQALQKKIVDDGGARFDATYFSPYHPDGCVEPYAIVHEDRKPGIGMLSKASIALGINLAKSYMVGDKGSDIECGLNGGLRGSLHITEGPGHPKALAHVTSLLEAESHIPAATSWVNSTL